MKQYWKSCLVICISVAACAANRVTSAKLTTDSNVAVAFPGAEGFGKYASGGRGGKVMVVSSLADNGPGSFREAASEKIPRIIVFAVSGTIHLETPLSIRGNATIAGQTAPGDGICIADRPVSLGGNNIIIRYLRFRMGDKFQNGGMVNGGGSDDAFGGTRRSNIIIDHCSLSWSTDEVFSVYSGDSTTLQWNIIAEPLNYSYHFENGDKDFERHGFGGIWGGKHLSAHHNLFAHCNSRTPRFDGIRNTSPENVDFRNNVIYNWGTNNVYAGEGGTYNIVNNYYKYGPSTSEKVRDRLVNPYRTDRIPFGKFYVDGNYSDASRDVTNDNWKGVTLEKGSPGDKEAARLQTPFSCEPVATQLPREAFRLVLAGAGASFRRDTLDQRLVNDVINRTGKLIDVQGGYKHGTPYSATANAWPVLKQGFTPPDRDRDGMPDEWELKHKLNPDDSTDAAKMASNGTYTNIEMYINALVASK